MRLLFQPGKFPQVLVATADEKIDENGAFSDEETLKFVSGLLESGSAGGNPPRAHLITPKAR